MFEENTYKKDDAYLNYHLENVSRSIMKNRLKIILNKKRYMLFHTGKIDNRKNTNLNIKISYSTISRKIIINFLVSQLTVILIGLPLLKKLKQNYYRQYVFCTNKVLFKSKFFVLNFPLTSDESC